MVIGIPKSFLYWKAPGYWEAFFEALGHKVVVSPPSDKFIVEAGASFADQETCFASKIYWGHIKWLEGKCDIIFAPRLMTDISGKEYCPKFFAVPDLAALAAKTPLLCPVFDSRKEPFLKTMDRLGKSAGAGAKQIRGALSACDALNNGLKEERSKSFFRKMKSDLKKILLVSHPYNLYDEYCNLQIEKKLAALGGCAVFLDEAESLDIGSEKKSDAIPALHWEFGREMLRTVPAVLDRYKFDGGVELSSFQCGCDAVIKEYVQEAFRSRDIPFLYLMIDEQTGEAGYQTRLEAFCDTLENSRKE